MKNIFTDHPRSIGESYWRHLFLASRFGSKMMIGGFACVLHAVFPFMFKTTGSNILLRMTNEFINRMAKIDERVETVARSIEAKRQQAYFYTNVTTPQQKKSPSKQYVNS